MQQRPSVQNSLPSPKLNLLESIQESDLLDEVFDFRDDADVLESEVEANIEQSTMDNQVFDRKMKEVKAEIRKVHWNIDMFTPEAVTRSHNESIVSAELKAIRNMYLLVKEKIYEFIDELNEDEEQVRIASLKKADEELSKRLKENDKAVYEKLAELNATNGSSISTAVTSRENIDQRKKEKIEVRIKNNLKKVKDLKLVVSSITKKPDDMSEDEIRDYLNESVKWEKKLESLTTIRDSIDEEAVCLDIDEDSKVEFDEEFNSLEEAVRDLVKNLAFKDKSLKLYSLSTKSKETVSYPSKFNGKETEDVYKFIKDFQKAITSDRVKKSE